MAAKDGTGGRYGKGRDIPAVSRRRRGAGFAQAARFVEDGVGRAAARRGLTETRLVTEWTEIAGAVAGAVTIPIAVRRRGKSLGGTLELRADPGRGPEIEMMVPQIIERVNACFGYRAISSIRLVQDGSTGFSEAEAGFDMTGAPSVLVAGSKEAPPEACNRVAEAVARIDDPELRRSLERLGLAIAKRAANQS